MIIVPTSLFKHLKSTKPIKSESEDGTIPGSLPQVQYNIDANVSYAGTMAHSTGMSETINFQF